MKVGVVANPDLQKSAAVVKRVMKFFAGRRIELEIDEAIAAKLGKKGVPLSEMESAVLVTIGGDGTVLRALQQTRARVLSVNAGEVGFLTEISPTDIEEKLAQFIAGKYQIDSRIRLKTLLGKRRLPDSLNEAVVHTSQISKMRRFKVCVDGKLSMDVRADGIVVATPTGSTCYAMSAGGPIVDPDVDAFVIAPLAPFKPSMRPLVVPATSVLTVETGHRKDCLLVLDGQQYEEIGAGSVLTFSRSERDAELIRFSDDFYKRIHEKLGML
ncbi:MAG: NAD(+)/NADH kinase [Methanobacteriota archaeon]